MKKVKVFGLGCLCGGEEEEDCSGLMTLGTSLDDEMEKRAIILFQDQKVAMLESVKISAMQGKKVEVKSCLLIVE